MNIETPTLADYVRSILIAAGYGEHNPRATRDDGFIVTPGPAGRAVGVKVADAESSSDPRNLLLALYANELHRAGLDTKDIGNFLIVTRKADR
jgi:hypothetical protein